MRGNRMIRVNDEIQREISEILRGEIKDPRVGAMVSVIKVDTTSDLKICKVYVSVFGDEEEKKGAMEGIRSANGFIRKQIAQRINLRVTPELKFILDNSVEYGIRLTKLIDDVNKSGSQREENGEKGEDAGV